MHFTVQVRSKCFYFESHFCSELCWKKGGIFFQGHFLNESGVIWTFSVKWCHGSEDRNQCRIYTFRSINWSSTTGSGTCWNTYTLRNFWNNFNSYINNNISCVHLKIIIIIKYFILDIFLDFFRCSKNRKRIS